MRAALKSQATARTSCANSNMQLAELSDPDDMAGAVGIASKFNGIPSWDKLLTGK